MNQPPKELRRRLSSGTDLQLSALCVACTLFLQLPLHASPAPQTHARHTRPPVKQPATPAIATGPTQPPCESAVQLHYDTAQQLQSSGSLNEAGLQFTLFIVQALHCLAQDRALIGQYSRAVPLFTQALDLRPGDLRLRLDFAAAAVAARDFAQARALLQQPLPAACKPTSCAEAHLLRGKALFGLGDLTGARDEFEQAVQQEPTFDHGVALARAQLALANRTAAAKIFAEMLSAYGDTAAIHLEFGKAYAEADFPEEAAREFRQTLARDPRFPEAHYCLGASYLMQTGDTGFPAAEAEFRAELALHPDDTFSYSQLGYIAMSRHNLPEAESDLVRATLLNPRNPDNFLLLGQIYSQSARPKEAEAALRQAIIVTDDPSRNHFQIRGGHYQLGQLLLARGATAEGKREMQITQELILQNHQQDAVNLTGEPAGRDRFPAPLAQPTVDRAAERAADDFERILRPALADAYNNLGVGSARSKDYSQASIFFHQSALWDPQGEDLDLNWGRAAYAAREYKQARVCFDRYLQGHPGAAGLREPLGVSAFMTGDYPAALSALRPLANTELLNPTAGYAYAESLMRTGDFSAGVAYLQLLETAHPQSNVFPLALGRAYVAHRAWSDAKRELEKERQLQPDDTETLHLFELVLSSLKHEQSSAGTIQGVGK